jgi:hypothetical protein
VPGNALELKPRVELLGHDPVLAGGLFDYLRDGIVARLLRTAHRQYLEPGGTFYFTNIARGNPYRLWMGVIGSWTLIERTEEDVRRLCARAGVPDTDVELVRDTSGLAWLVQVRRQADRWGLSRSSVVSTISGGRRARPSHAAEKRRFDVSAGIGGPYGARRGV